MSHTDLRDTPSNPVPPTIQESNRVSENNSPDTIEMLYIESPSIGLVEFRKRIEALITQQVTAAQTNGVAWTIKVIDELHFGKLGEHNDAIFKGMKNTIRDRYKYEAGVDPAPSYPISATLQSTLIKDKEHIDRGSGFTHADSVSGCACLELNAKEDTL